MHKNNVILSARNRAVCVHPMFKIDRIRSIEPIRGHYIHRKCGGLGRSRSAPKCLCAESSPHNAGDAVSRQYKMQIMAAEDLWRSSNNVFLHIFIKKINFKEQDRCHFSIENKTKNVRFKPDKEGLDNTEIRDSGHSRVIEHGYDDVSAVSLNDNVALLVMATNGLS